VPLVISFQSFNSCLPQTLTGEVYMQKVDRFWYKVNLQENVTIAINPSVNLGHLYTANLDGHAMAKPSDGIYRFTVTRPVGKTHFFIIYFDFTAAPDGSQYRVVIDGSGSNNSGPFSLTVRKNDPQKMKTIQFEVV
jgi:hypothetical protein